MNATKTTETQRQQKALETAQAIAGDDASCSIHYGRRGEVAIRITGCFKDDATRIAREIAHALPGTPVSDSSFVAVWF